MQTTHKDKDIRTLIRFAICSIKIIAVIAIEVALIIKLGASDAIGINIILLTLKCLPHKLFECGYDKAISTVSWFEIGVLFIIGIDGWMTHPAISIIALYVMGFLGFIFGLYLIFEIRDIAKYIGDQIHTAEKAIEDHIISIMTPRRHGQILKAEESSLYNHDPG